jgi:hypothetical protein
LQNETAIATGTLKASVFNIQKEAELGPMVIPSKKQESHSSTMGH